MISRNDTNDNNVPAPVPAANALIRRTQTTLGLLQEVVRESSAEYWYERGKMASAREEWEEAQYSFDLCLKLDYNHWRGTLQIALVLAHIQQENRASAMLIRAYEMRYSTYIDFSNEITLQQWQVLCQKLESIQSSHEDTFENSLALALATWMTNDPKFSHPYQIKVARFMLDEIKNKYRNQSHLSVLWHRLSGTCRNGNYENENVETLNNYNQAVSLNPNHAAAYHERGRFKVQHFKDYAGALADYSKSIDLDPNQSNTLAAVAGIKSHLKNYAGAIDASSRAIALEPQNLFAYRTRAQAKNDTSDNDGALADYHQLISLTLNSDKPNPSNAANYYRKIGLIKDKIQDYYGALIAFNESINLSPISETILERGLTRFKLQDFAGAIDDYSAVIERGESSKKLTTYIARIEAKSMLGNYTDALFDCDTLINLWPWNATSYSIRSKIKEKAGDSKGAQADLEEASKLIASGYKDYLKKN